MNIETPADYISPRLAAAAASIRPESEVRARRIKLVAGLRAEGANDAAVERLATDEVVTRMMDHEQRCVAMARGLFGARQ